MPGEWLAKSLRHASFPKRPAFLLGHGFALHWSASRSPSDGLMRRRNRRSRAPKPGSLRAGIPEPTAFHATEKSRGVAARHEIRRV
jgi:hypothetical protein